MMYALWTDYGILKEKLRRENVFKDILRVNSDPFLVPFELFVMNEKQLSTYLYSNLHRPLKKNTDDLLLTEFSTPKHLTMRKNVEKFSLSEHLHGNTQWLMQMIKNFDVEEIRLLMERKIEKGV